MPDERRHSPLWLLDAGEEHLLLAQEWWERREALPWWALFERARSRHRCRHHERVSHAFYKAAAQTGGER